MGKGGQLALAVGMWLAALPAAAHAQFFIGSRHPAAARRRAVGGTAAAEFVPPPAASPRRRRVRRCSRCRRWRHRRRPRNPGPSIPPPGHVSLAVSARFGPDLPAINGGLHWRIYASRPEQNGRAAARQGRAGRRPDLLAAGRQLRRQCRLRPRERDQGGAAALGQRARSVRNSGRRLAHRRPRRRRQDPARRRFRSISTRAASSSPATSGRSPPTSRPATSSWCPRAPITSSRTTATPTRRCAPTSACRSAS